MVMDAKLNPPVTRAGATLPRRELFDAGTGDLFAGWGGFTLGKEMATGRTVEFCVNHSEQAIKYHTINHPHARHFRCDVREVTPSDVVSSRLSLLTASPDCTHFSPARGAAPVSESVRSLAWVLIDWAGCPVARPEVIIVENVPAFVKWGPVHHATDEDGAPKFDNKGRPWMVPIPGREGEEFDKWVASFHKLGYQTDWRVLDAADYGVPQHRRRFFFIARSDGMPITWPKPTHGPAGSGLLPYRTAAECIDWSLPCPSIFMTKAQGRKFKKSTGIEVKRPLAENTLSRTGMGIFRFVLENEDPFIVDTNHGPSSSTDSRFRSVNEPMSAVTRAHGQAVVVPGIINIERPQNPFVGGAVNAPLGTITGSPKGGKHALIAPTIATIGYGERAGQQPRARRVNEPMTTVVGQGPKAAIVEPVLIGMGGSGYAAKPRSTNRPSGVVKCHDRHGIVTPIIAQFNTNPGGTVNPGHDVRDPVSTVACRGPHQGVVAPTLMKFRGDSCGQKIDGPSPTVTSGAGAVRPAGAAHALGIVAPTLIPCGGPKRQPSSPDQPKNAVLTREDTALTHAFLVKFRGTSAHGQEVDQPGPSITGGGQHESIAAVSLVRFNQENGSEANVYHGSGGQWSNPAEPCTTVTAMDGKALMEAKTEPPSEAWPVEVLERAQQVAKFLRKYVGKRLARDLADARRKLHPRQKRTAAKVQKIEQQLVRFESHFAPMLEETADGFRQVGELVLLTARGAVHVMVDIGLRMFVPRELARCQGFPDSYILPTNKAVAVKLIGNSVPPPLVAALISSNCPQLCTPPRTHRRRRAGVGVAA